jgi:hypothetical protein
MLDEGGSEGASRCRFERAGQRRCDAVLVQVREFDVQSLGEPLAERRQCLGRRGARLLAAEMRRQQTAMLNEMSRQMVRFWTGAWGQPSADARKRRRHA